MVAPPECPRHSATVHCTAVAVGAFCVCVPRLTRVAPTTGGCSTTLGDVPSRCLPVRRRSSPGLCASPHDACQERPRARVGDHRGGKAGRRTEQHEQARSQTEAGRGSGMPTVLLFLLFHGNLKLCIPSTASSKASDFSSSRGLMEEAAEAPLCDVPVLHTGELVASDAAATALTRAFLYFSLLPGWSYAQPE